MPLRIFIFFILFFLSFEVFARAGGGGGLSSCDSIRCLLLYPLYFLNVYLIGFLLPRKHLQAKKLLKQLTFERNWNLEKINQRTKDVFFKVQEAREKRDQDIAKDFISDTIYKKHKLYTDGFIKKGIINKLTYMKLKDIKIVEVNDKNGVNKG